MSHCFTDGCDGYGATADIAKKYNAVDPSVTLQVAGGRWGGGAIRLPDDSDYIRKTLPDPGLDSHGDPYARAADWNTLHFVFHIKASTVIVEDTLVRYTALTSPGNDDGGGIKIDNTGLLQGEQWGDGGPTSSYGTKTTTAIDDGAYHHVEVAVNHDGTDGSLKIWIDGNLEVDFTGDNLHSGEFGTQGVDQITFYGVESAGVGADYDDIVVWDRYAAMGGTTAFYPLVLGQHRIATTWPDGEGNQNDFTPTGDTDNYLCVDEVSADDDTTYMQSSSDAALSLFAMDDLGFTPAAIHAAISNGRMKNPDIGSIGAWAVCRNGGAQTVFGGDYITGAYAHYQSSILYDPATGTNWTTYGASQAEFGRQVWVP